MSSIENKVTEMARRWLDKNSHNRIVAHNEFHFRNCYAEAFAECAAEFRKLMKLESTKDSDVLPGIAMEWLKVDSKYQKLWESIRNKIPSTQEYFLAHFYDIGPGGTWSVKLPGGEQRTVELASYEMQWVLAIEPPRRVISSREANRCREEGITVEQR